MLRRGGVLVTLRVAARVAVKAELNESTATAAIKMLRVRINFLPMFKTLNRSINAERQSQFPLLFPLKAKSGHGRSPALAPGFFMRLTDAFGGIVAAEHPFMDLTTCSRVCSLQGDKQGNNVDA